MSECVYCALPPEEAWIVNLDAVAVPHPQPLCTCHVVVVPRRHVCAFFDLDVLEQRAVWDLVTEIRQRVARSMRVDGFRVGFVDSPPGEDSHFYLHVVPHISGEEVVLPAGVEWVDPGGQ